MNKLITLEERPEGTPTESNFEIKTEEKPTPKTGEVLLASKYISVDPYLRGRMSNADSYISPFQLHEPMASMIVAEVIASKNENFVEGDYVSGMLEWKEFQTHTGKGLNKIENKEVPLSAYLGVLGLTGLTAYLALDTIGNLKKGETLLVSGAAGAVGSVVGQIGKIKGCKVVGIAGTDKKIDHIKSKFNFDAGINYKTTDNMAEAIAENCPDGVDVYYDNVGGDILDAAMQNINDFARIINCGAISIYNKKEVPTGMRLEGIMVKKRALMQGFILGDHSNRFPEAIKQLADWLSAGKLDFDETIREGFENVPKAFLELFEGKNLGKMVVKI